MKLLRLPLLAAAMTKLLMCYAVGIAGHVWESELRITWFLAW